MNLTETLNNHFPLVRQSRKIFKEKPYITNGIRVSLKSRETLHKIFLDNPTEENERNFKTKRNKIVDIIRKAESDYYAAAIKNHADSNRQLWKTFSKIFNKNTIKISCSCMPNLERQITKHNQNVLGNNEKIQIMRNENAIVKSKMIAL